APALGAVAVTGSGDVTVDRVQGDALDLALSGSGSLSVGTVDVGALLAVMTGSGDMSLTGKARTANATVTGSGDLR
ncbi:GIN domain-containing protein, partial [Curtobacterium sp. B18]|uniref:GIN domain-containing protein n=1 Tax=Curtobacterium sp. B18 TaxID=95614 RepID=UPI0004CEA6AD